MNLKFPPVGCGRRFLITMNGEPFAGFDDEKHAYDVLRMYRDQKRPSNSEKYRWELKTQTPQDHLDPLKEGKK